MSTDTKLGVWFDGEQWVVAASAEDADAVMRETCGEDSLAGEWERLPDEQELGMDDDGAKTTRTCAEWAADGRAYLGGVDY